MSPVSRWTQNDCGVRQVKSFIVRSFKQEEPPNRRYATAWTLMRALLVCARNNERAWRSDKDTQRCVQPKKTKERTNRTAQRRVWWILAPLHFVCTVQISSRSTTVSVIGCVESLHWRQIDFSSAVRSVKRQQNLMAVQLTAAVAKIVFPFAWYRFPSRLSRPDHATNWRKKRCALIHTQQ